MAAALAFKKPAYYAKLYNIMKSNNFARKGMVSTSKIPGSVSNLLQTVFKNCDQVFCTQRQNNQNAIFSFAMPEGINILLAIQEESQASDILFANGRAYIDMEEFVKLQLEYSELLATCIKKQPCKMIVMKGGIA